MIHGVPHIEFPSLHGFANISRILVPPLQCPLRINHARSFILVVDRIPDLRRVISPLRLRRSWATHESPCSSWRALNWGEIFPELWGSLAFLTETFTLLLVGHVVSSEYVSLIRFLYLLELQIAILTAIAWCWKHLLIPLLMLHRFFVLKEELHIWLWRS